MSGTDSRSFTLAIPPGVRSYRLRCICNIGLYDASGPLANHYAIMKNVGIQPEEYPYFQPKTIGLDFEGFTGALRSAVPRSIFLLHACAHNPTGVDPTPEQWEQLATIFLEKGHYAFFDCAYQGFASGDLDKDAGPVRYFEQRGVPMLVCQVSF